MSNRAPHTATLDRVTYRYPNANQTAIRDESWDIADGSFALVVGRSGSGKSTLLRTLNGLVPHFSGGAFGGRVHIGQADTRFAGPRELSQQVGFVFQDPEAQLVTDRVDSEIAFGLEQHGIDRITMGKRVEEALDYLGIEPLRKRNPQELSGGERQRVAIAATLALHPRMLVLDEPTSQLDPWSAEDVINVLSRLNDDAGLTIVVAEHRLERLLPRADVVRYFAGAGTPSTSGSAREMAQQFPSVALPPITRLARELACHPLPLSIKEARQGPLGTYRHHLADESCQKEVAGAPPGDIIARMDGITVELGPRRVLNQVSLTVRQGELVALMGRNGSGKTTLLRSIAGLQPVSEGTVLTLGHDMRRHTPADLGGQVGYLPQHASSLFFRDRLRDELLPPAGQSRASIDPERDLARFGLADRVDSHPLDLSGGERERAALATVLAGQPHLLLLDEPTRGMDAWRKAELAQHLRALTDDGVAIVLVTHDVELVAECATRVMMLANGDIIASGPPRSVLTGSLTYTTQVNKVFGGSWLTVPDVLTAIRAAGKRTPTQ